MVGQGAVCEALVPIGTPGDEVDAPRVVVESDHPTGTALLGQEGVLAVPRPDVDDTAPGHVGKYLGAAWLHADALGHHSTAQVDGVKPHQGVSLVLQVFLGRHSGSG